MKKLFLLMIAMAVLAGSSFLGAYELTADNWKVLPEAIWAAATGGGTWYTEVQITNLANSDTEVNVYFYYGSSGSSRGSFVLTTLTANQTYRTTNILSTIDTLDTGVFDYYGKVGTLWFWTTGGTNRIHVTAKTWHSSGYSKSLPAMRPTLGNSAAMSRPIMIPLMYNGSAHRSTVGFFNSSLSTSITANMYVMSPNSYSYYGSVITKTFPAGDYQAFNPFIAAGIDGNVYTNTWLLVILSAGPTNTDPRGLMGFGSIVNNTTNDPAAALAYPWDLANTAAPEAAALSPDPNK